MTTYVLISHPESALESAAMFTAYRAMLTVIAFRFLILHGLRPLMVCHLSLTTVQSRRPNC